MHYIAARLQHGRGMASPLLQGGGLWSSLKKGFSSLVGMGHRVTAAVAPVLGSVAQTAAKTALDAALGGQGNISSRLHHGLRAGLQSVDRGALGQNLLAAARPVFS
jgi:hypothetical protein